MPISLNNCFGCSKEPSHWDGSFEYPQHMFWLRNKKIIFVTHSYLKACSTLMNICFQMNLILCKVLDLRSKGCWFETHLFKALRCVLSIDTLFSALYWFNPGRQEIILTLLKNCWLGCKVSTQTNNTIFFVWTYSVQCPRDKFLFTNVTKMKILEKYVCKIPWSAIVHSNYLMTLWPWALKCIDLYFSVYGVIVRNSVPKRTSSYQHMNVP